MKHHLHMSATESPPPRSIDNLMVSFFNNELRTLSENRGPRNCCQCVAGGSWKELDRRGSYLDKGHTLALEPEVHAQ